MDRALRRRIVERHLETGGGEPAPEQGGAFAVVLAWGIHGRDPDQFPAERGNLSAGRVRLAKDPRLEAAARPDGAASKPRIPLRGTAGRCPDLTGGPHFDNIGNMERTAGRPTADALESPCALSPESRLDVFRRLVEGGPDRLAVGGRRQALQVAPSDLLVPPERTRPGRAAELLPPWQVPGLQGELPGDPGSARTPDGALLLRRGVRTRGSAGRGERAVLMRPRGRGRVGRSRQ